MFNIGDKVRVIKDTCCHREPIGSILTIKSCFGISNGLNVYRYYYSGGINSMNYVLDEDIEPLYKVEPKKLLMNYLCSHKSQ